MIDPRYRTTNYLGLLMYLKKKKQNCSGGRWLWII